MQDEAQVLALRGTTRGSDAERDLIRHAGDALPAGRRPADEPADGALAEGVVLTFADITVQKKVEQVSADRFSLAFHAGPMAASIVTRGDGRFLDVNENFEQITGYRREEVVGQSARSFGFYFGDELDQAPTNRPDEQAVDEVETQIRTSRATCTSWSSLEPPLSSKDSRATSNSSAT